MSFVYGELLLNYFKLKEKYPRLARVIAMPTDPWTNNNFIWNKKYFNRGKGFIFNNFNFSRFYSSTSLFKEDDSVQNNSNLLTDINQNCNNNIDSK